MTPEDSALLETPESSAARLATIGFNPAETSSAPPDTRGLLEALQAVRAGDFSVRLPSHQDGEAGRIADAFNDIVAANARMAQQLEHVGEVVGRQGKTRTRVRFGLSSGAWGDMEDSVNTLINDLVWPTTEVTRAVGITRREAIEAVMKKAL